MKKLYNCLLVLCAVVGICNSVYAETQIPKKIHYVWFGEDEEPETVKRSIESWKRHMPDYEIKRWNEKNSDVTENPWVKESFEQKYWQLASDWCRLKAVYEEGGIYMDTDVFVRAPFGELLKKPLILTWQADTELSAGIFAAVPKHKYLKKMLDFYASLKGASWGYSAPNVFYSVFKDMNLSKEEYIVYPANVFMFDFGGPETKAEHLYAAGASYVEFCNGYYKMYAKVFLAQHAFCIKNCYHPGKEEWIVPYTKDLFYKVGWQWFGCLYRDEPIVMGSYDLKMEQGVALLNLKYKNGEKSFYICLDRKCNIKSK